MIACASSTRIWVAGGSISTTSGWHAARARGPRRARRRRARSPRPRSTAPPLRRRNPAGRRGGTRAPGGSRRAAAARPRAPARRRVPTARWPPWSSSCQERRRPRRRRAPATASTSPSASTTIQPRSAASVAVRRAHRGVERRHLRASSRSLLVGPARVARPRRTRRARARVGLEPGGRDRGSSRSTTSTPRPRTTPWYTSDDGT